MYNINFDIRKSEKARQIESNLQTEWLKIGSLFYSTNIVYTFRRYAVECVTSREVYTYAFSCHSLPWSWITGRDEITNRSQVEHSIHCPVGSNPCQCVSYHQYDQHNWWQKNQIVLWCDAIWQESS